jgi:hypothetical protein
MWWKNPAIFRFYLLFVKQYLHWIQKPEYLPSTFLLVGKEIDQSMYILIASVNGFWASIEFIIL